MKVILGKKKLLSISQVHSGQFMKRKVRLKFVRSNITKHYQMENIEPSTEDTSI